MTIKSALWLAMLCACGKAAATAPNIDSFIANPERVPVGGTSTLSWHVEDYSSCTLSSTQPPNFSVTAAVPSGSKTVTMGQIPTVFLLTCTAKPTTAGGQAPAPTVAEAYVSLQE